MAINKRKDKNQKIHYQVRVKDPQGRWYPAITFERLVDAERHERELMANRDSGNKAISQEQKAMTVNEYWHLWTERCRQVHDGWKISQNQMYRDYIKPNLGSQKLIEIRPQDVGMVLAYARKAGRSAQTQQHIFSLMHKMFNDAVEYLELLERNPALRRDRPQVIHVERAFLPPADAARLRAVAKDHFLGPAIWIASLCGLRPSEVQALKWESVDFERGQILIQAAYKRRVRRIEPFPKGKRQARVPMPPVLSSYLARYREGHSPEDFAASGLRGGMLKYELFLEGLRKLCKQAGVKTVTPHELRHSCSEEWVQAGASLEDVCRVLNHSNSGVTVRYMHRTDDRLTALAQNVGLTNVLPFKTGT